MQAAALRPGCTAMTRARRIAWLIWLAWMLAPAPAQALHAESGGAKQALSQYKVDVWQTEQGLPLNTVQTLLQTRDGYLWVGTAGGLARFDGVRFTTYDSSQAPDMASQPIFGLMEDAQQNLWIGHSKGCLLYTSPSPRDS